jgi:hypothetical protein
MLPKTGLSPIGISEPLGIEEICPSSKILRGNLTIELENMAENSGEISLNIKGSLKDMARFDLGAWKDSGY